MDGGPILTRGREGRGLVVVALSVIALLAILVVVVSIARGGLPLVGLLVSILLLAPVVWFVVFTRR